MRRPSYREIDKRLKEALENRRVAFANPDKVVGELINLEIGPTDEVWELILKLINEICPKHYKGAYPPLKSYESKTENYDLWAFSWDSCLLKQRMYLKFSIKDGFFYYVSLHKCKSSEE